MAFRIKADRTIGEEILRLLHEQLSRAIRAADNRRHAPAERARQIRVACKKIRAVLELVRCHVPNHFKREDRRFRDAARRIAPVRDHGAVLSTFQSLPRKAADRALAERRSLRRIRQALRGHLRLHSDVSVTADTVLQTCCRKLRKERARLDHIKFKGQKQEGFAFIEAGFRRSYARARATFCEATKSANDDALHTWRKRTKTHLNQCRLLERICPGVLPPRVRELKHLSSLLGDEHDLVVLREEIGETVFSEQDQRTVKLYLQQVDRRLTTLKSNALAKGQIVFSEKPRTFVTRVETDWNATRSTASQRGSKKT